MFRKNLYDSFVSCLERYPLYFRKGEDFISNYDPIEQFLQKCGDWVKNTSSSHEFIVQIEGEEGSGKSTLSRQVYKKFFCEKTVLFFELSNVTQSFPDKKEQKFLIYYNIDRSSSKENELLLKTLFMENKVAGLIIGSQNKSSLNLEKQFPTHSDLKLKLPCFSERICDRYLVLSYFLSLLSPSVFLTPEAFSFYGKVAQFKTVFELKYTCLWSHYKAMSQKLDCITAENLKSSLEFVLKYKKEFLMLEKLDFSSFLGLIKKVGYKNLMDFQDHMLIEIIMRTQRSYAKSSSYTGLPITTIRSKRLKKFKT